MILAVSETHVDGFEPTGGAEQQEAHVRCLILALVSMTPFHYAFRLICWPASSAPRRVLAGRGRGPRQRHLLTPAGTNRFRSMASK